MCAYVHVCCVHVCVVCLCVEQSFVVLANMPNVCMCVHVRVNIIYGIFLSGKTSAAVRVENGYSHEILCSSM